jgi:hypothetical protein
MTWAVLLLAVFAAGYWTGQHVIRRLVVDQVEQVEREAWEDGFAEGLRCASEPLPDEVESALLDAAEQATPPPNYEAWLN